MAFTKQNLFNFKGLAVVLALLPLVGTANINCEGKAFHCVNSTHFIICVDLGGGLSSTIDDFVIPCPPATECQRSNHYECEFPLPTTQTPVLEPLISTTLVPADDTTIILTQSTPANTDANTTAFQSATYVYFNTVSPTTVSENLVNTITENIIDATVTTNLQTLEIVNNTEKELQSTTTYIENKYLINTESNTKSAVDIIDLKYYSFKNTVTENGLYDAPSINFTVTTTEVNIGKNNSTYTEKLSSLSSETERQFNKDSSTSKNGEISEVSQGDSTTNTDINKTISTVLQQSQTIYPHNVNSAATEMVTYLTTDHSGILLEKLKPDLLPEVGSTPHIDTITHATNKKLVTQNSRIDARASEIAVPEESMFPTVTETSPLPGKIDDTSERLINIENVTQNNSILLLTEVTISSDITIHSSNTNDSVFVKNPKNNDTTINPTDSMSSWVTQGNVAIGSTDTSTKMLMTSGGVKRNSTDWFSSEVKSTLPSTDMSFYMTDKNVVMKNTIAEETATKVEFTTDPYQPLSTLPEVFQVSDDQDITVKKFITLPESLTETVIQNYSGKLPTESLSASKLEEMVTTEAVTGDPLTSASSISEVSPASINPDVTIENLYTTQSTNRNKSSILYMEELTTSTNFGSSSTEQNSKVKESLTKEVVTTDSLTSTTTEVSLVSTGIDITTENLFTSKNARQHSFDILPMEIMTADPNTDVGSYITQNSSFLQNSKVEEVATREDLTTDSLISIVTEVPIANSVLDVTNDNSFALDSKKQNNSGVIYSDVLTTPPNPDTSEYTMNNSLLIDDSMVKEITTKSTVAEVSLSNGGTDVTIKNVFISESTKQNIGDILLTEVFTTTSNVEHSPFSTESQTFTVTEVYPTIGDTEVTNEYLLTLEKTKENSAGFLSTKMPLTNSNFDYNTVIQTSKVESSITRVVSTTDSINSTITSISPASAATSRTDTTAESSLTSEIAKQNNNDMLSTTIPKSLLNIEINPYTINHNSQLNNSKVEDSTTNVTNLKFATDSVMITVTEISPASGGSGVTAENLFASEKAKENTSGLFSTGLLSTPSNSDIRSNKTVSSLSSQNTNMEQTTSKVESPTVSSTVIEGVPTIDGIGSTTGNMITSEITKQNSLGTSSTETFITNHNFVYNSPIQNSKVKWTRSSGAKTVTTDSIKSTVNDIVPTSDSTDTTTESLLILENATHNSSDLLSTGILISQQNINFSENKSLLQNDKVKNITTKVNLTGDSLMSTVTEVSIPVSGAIDVNTENLFTLESTKQDISGLLTIEVLSTSSNYDMSTHTTDKSLFIQNTNVEQTANKVAIPEDSLMYTVTKVIPADGSINDITKDSFISDNTKQNSSGISATEIHMKSPNPDYSTTIQNLKMEGSSTNGISEITTKNLLTLKTANLSSSGILSTGALISLPNTNSNPYTTDNIFKMKEPSTKLPVTIDLSMSIVKEVPSITGDTESTAENLLLLENATQNSSNLLSTGILTSLRNTGISENSSLLYNNKDKDAATKVNLNVDSLLSTVTKVYPITGAIDVPAESSFTLESKQNNSGLLSIEVLSTDSNSFISSFTPDDSLFIEKINVEQTATKKPFNTGTLTSTVIAASPVIVGPGETTEDMFSTKNDSEFSTTEIFITNPYYDYNSITQNFKVKETVAKVITTIDTIKSTATDRSPAIGGVDTNAESLLSSESAKPNSSEMFSMGIMTSLLNIDINSYIRDNSSLLQNNKMATNVTKDVTDSLVSAVTESSLTPGPISVTADSLYASKSDNQDKSGLLSIGELSTPSNYVIVNSANSSSYRTDNNLFIVNINIEQAATEVAVTADSLISTVTEVYPAVDSRNDIIKNMFTSAYTERSNSGLSATKKFTRSPNFDHSTITQNSKVEGSATKIVSTGDFQTSTINYIPLASGTNTTSEDLFTSESGRQNNDSSSLSMRAQKILPNKDNISDIKVSSLLIQNSKPTITNQSPVSGSSNVTSERSIILKSAKQNESKLLSMETITTPNSHILQNSKNNTELNILTITEIAPRNSENHTGLDLFTTDQVKDNGYDRKPSETQIKPESAYFPTSDIFTQSVTEQVSESLEASEYQNNTDKSKTTITMFLDSQNIRVENIKGNFSTTDKSKRDVNTIESLVLAPDSEIIKNNNTFTNSTKVVKFIAIPIYETLGKNKSTDKNKSTIEFVKSKTAPSTKKPNLTTLYDLIINHGTFSLPSPIHDKSNKKTDSLIIPQNISTSTKGSYNNFAKHEDNNVGENGEVVTKQDSFIVSTIKILPFDVETQTNSNQANETKLNMRPHNMSVYQNDGAKTDSFNGNKLKHYHILTYNTREELNASNWNEKEQTETDNLHKIVDVSKNISTPYSCKRHSRGKYPDNEDCQKFYICIGRKQPIIGMCPVNTVFSESRKQCTSNLSHCIRNNQLRCNSEGRFSDYLQTNTYYICVKKNENTFARYRLQCQNGYYLNRTSVRCSPITDLSSQSSSSSIDNSNRESDESTKSTSEDSSKSTSEDKSHMKSSQSSKSSSEDSSMSTNEDMSSIRSDSSKSSSGDSSKSAYEDNSNTKSDQSSKSSSGDSSKSTYEDNSNTKSDQSSKSSSDNSKMSAGSTFHCTEEGKFVDPNNSRRFFKCSTNRTLGFKIKRKNCNDNKIFNQDKQKCVDDDSSD